MTKKVKVEEKKKKKRKRPPTDDDDEDDDYQDEVTNLTIYSVIHLLQLSQFGFFSYHIL